jgi:nicotinate phosphoribosyltransferase
MYGPNQATVTVAKPRSESMIKSILDNDLYTFTMCNAILQKFSKVRVGWKFTDRKAKGRWTQEALAELQARVNALSTLSLTREERIWCEAKLPWINHTFWDFLANYRFDPSEIKLSLNKKNNLQIEIEGLWCRTIFWEVPLLALICEVWYEMIDTNWNEDGQVEKMEAKAKRLAEIGALWGDFGTRRRRNFSAQERVVMIGKKYKNFTGTSNVYLAMKHDVKPLGTMAHAWIMAHSALVDLRHANKAALENWNEVYQGNLGTALPDTFGTDVFLRDFQGVLARCFDSVRHDSGDPYEWAEKMIAHYTKIGIDWKTKPLGFTDGNTDESAIAIHKWVTARGGKCWFGIGTSFSNDYGPDSPALSIVIKMAWVQDPISGMIIPVVKISDTPEKATGDEDALRVAMWVHYGRSLDHGRAPANATTDGGNGKAA